MQAVQLQYLPRMKIDHTSHKEIGQIYVANMNWALMVCCIALVISFGSSTALAAAYGIAVTMTMLITTILFYFVARYSWNWSVFVALPLCGFFAIVELCYFGANCLKIVHGGWFPLVVGALIFIVMTSWNRGRKILSERMLEMVTPVTDVIAMMKEKDIHRSPGVAVYMAGQPKFLPSSLTINMHHHSTLHEVIVIVTVKTEEDPYVELEHRAILKHVGQGVYKLQLHYGFMEIPDVPKALAQIRLENGKTLPLETITYFLGQEHLMAKENGKGMVLWRERLFAFMARNSQAASRFFNLPPQQVITVGLMIEL